MILSTPGGAISSFATLLMGWYSDKKVYITFESDPLILFQYADLFHYKERENDSHTLSYDPHDRWNNNAGGAQ